MRLCIVNIEFPPIGGGGGNATFYLARELVRRGHDVHVLTSKCFGLSAQETVEGISVFRVPVRRERMDFCSVREMGTFLLSALVKAPQLASRFRYDLVYAVFGVPCGPVGWLLKRTHGIPYMIRMGGGDIPGFKPYGYASHYRRVLPFVKRLWNDANGLIVVSADLERRVREVHPDGPVPRVIPNGVDLTEFFPRSSSRAEERVNIMTVSRLIDRKRIDILLTAAMRLRERTNIPFHVTIVGDGVHRPFLESFVVTNALQDLVTFRGNVPHAQMADMLRTADVFVLTSLAEGMPNVLLEALAAGLPLICTDTGGALELVHPGVNGYVVPHEDPETIANHLVWLLEHPKERAAFGARSREYAKNFSWETLSERTEHFCHEVIEKFRREKAQS